MEHSSQSSAELVADNALAEENKAPLDAAKANGKVNLRGGAESNRSSAFVAGHVTEISVSAEFSANKTSNSSVKDFDPASPSASRRTPLDSDSKGGLRLHDTPHPHGGL